MQRAPAAGAFLTVGIYYPPLVPVCAVQLPLDGRLRRSVLEHRKSLGERLAHLGVAVMRRKRSAAWSTWMEEARRWMEEQHLVRVDGPTDFGCVEMLSNARAGAVASNCSPARFVGIPNCLSLLIFMVHFLPNSSR